MAGTQYRIPLFDLLMALCTAVDIYSPVVANHHKRVAYIALRLAQELGMKAAQRDGVALAGMVHDIGAFSLKERQDIIALDLTDVGKHAEVGYAFLKRFEPFAATAEIIRYHHLA